MTQKQEILKMLQDAGGSGVSGKHFYRVFKGRGVARIYDLRKDGYEISAERDPLDPKYKIYRLVPRCPSCGCTGGDSCPECIYGVPLAAGAKGQTLGSGVEPRRSSSPAVPAPPARRSMYDPFEGA